MIAAGVKRVVAAMRDPNPLVSGRGFARLQAAGIEVDEGLCKTEARKLNEAFAKYIRRKTPFVTLKTAMTLDGKIAPPPVRGRDRARPGIDGASGGWITSEEARAHVHEMRHANDAIMVGVGTIIADDPLLTDRTGLPRRRPLLRVILDSRLRLPLDSRVVKTARRGPHRLLLLRRGEQAAANWKRAASWWSRSRCVGRWRTAHMRFPGSSPDNRWPTRPGARDGDDWASGKSPA